MYFELLMATYITLLALLVEHSLAHWYQQSVTVHLELWCMSYHKVIVVITVGRLHCFHDCQIGGVIIYGQNI